MARLGVVIPVPTNIRFAAASAVYTTAVARRGLDAENGIDDMPAERVGFPNARNLLIPACRIKSDEAVRMRLVNRCYAGGSITSQVRPYPTALAIQVSPRFMRRIHERLYQTRSRSFGGWLQVGANQVLGSLANEDLQEGVARFVEHRVSNRMGRQDDGADGVGQVTRS